MQQRRQLATSDDIAAGAVAQDDLRMKWNGIMPSGASRCNAAMAASGALWMLLGLISGCSPGGAASVSPEAAAALAVEQYDSNHDGSIDSKELTKCPPLVVALPAYDANGNGSIEMDEISQRLKRLYASSITLAEVSINVTADGQPLSGAVVRLRPAEFMGPGMTSAEGTTDETGIAKPAIAEEHVPTEFRGSPLVQFGPYLVEVTHPERQIPAKYNTASELGIEVDPSSRNGLSARFDLTTK